MSIKSSRRDYSAEKRTFLAMYQSGGLRDPRTGDWVTTYYLSRLLNAPKATIKRWIDKWCPEMTARLAERGTKTKGFYTATKARFIETVQLGEHVFATGRVVPCYLLAHDLGISPTTLMNWGRELFPELAERWAQGHCFPRGGVASPEIDAMRGNQKAAVSKRQRYKRGVNTRRINAHRKALERDGHAV